jgi:hypothetical protein
MIVVRPPHKVTGSIYKTGEKKPLYTLQGEWNNQIFIKRAGESKETLFTDVRQKPDVKKVNDLLIMQILHLHLLTFRNVYQ